jgi:pimeloyl-ACP methyl ester carboxylesterase
MPDPQHPDPPAVVLVHGALTDASVWNRVAATLQGDGYETFAPALPLRSVAGDVEHLSAFLDTVDGPLVLAGHSYGGTVISHPAIGRNAIRGLVFAAAFQPEAGESTGELNGRYPGSRLGEETVEIRGYPGGSDLYLRQADFADVYAADLPPAEVAVMAAAQRPIDPAALEETFAGEPTWRRFASWTVIATSDRSLPPAAQRFMAERAGSTAVEVDASHAAPLSHADVVADAIRAAARNTLAA